MEALKAVDVCHSYGNGEGKCNVLKNFSLTLMPGEFVALMGPSGSGKSTFLHLASGLLIPDSGHIMIGGEEITAMSDHTATKFRRRHIGVVFQSFNLVEAMTVAENIVLTARLDHAKKDQSRLEELISTLGLKGKESRLPAELSGGERQRTAIARALFSRPDVVLADEPTGNLDSKTSRAICSTLSALKESEKSAILMVTHDPQVASTADKVCFLANGAISGMYLTDHDAAKVSTLYLENCK